MTVNWPRSRPFEIRSAIRVGAAAAAAAVLAAAPLAQAHPDHHKHHARGLPPGSVVVSGSVYDAPPSIITANQTVLPGCATAAAPKSCKATGGKAINDGTYPFVFNNDTVDGSFGVSSPAFLYDFNRKGHPIRTLPIPSGDLVTSFSSKSEMGLNFSTQGRDLTLMGYAAPDATLDVSNSNTPGVPDPTNPVASSYYRVVGELNRHGEFGFTETNAYSGNNGRAAILNSADNVFYTAGNAGNGANPQPNGVILGAGAQLLTPATQPEGAQTPPSPPTPVGSFNITQLTGITKPDKIGKDTNFRGLTIYHDVVYFTKGSGGNGVNTVYFVDTTGTACSNGGVGLPVPGARLPTSPIAYDASALQTKGVTPYNMCVLKGFNTQLASTDTADFPFGMWFAGPRTLYVADEGNGTNTYDPITKTYPAAAAQTTAGLQKWVFDGTQWQRQYTLQSGLNLGQPYVVPGYPTGTNVATGLPWAPATDGLRNITGRVDHDGTVTIYGVTSTVSGSGDQGADPNQVVAITDRLAATSPGGESFASFDSAASGQVLRGVAVVPGSDERDRRDGRKR